uniref:SET domain-containing protein n=1 Tax=Angiostrongylus cantonensis TaxID=6313 RepID=A0A158PCN2_ANGCA
MRTLECDNMGVEIDGRQLHYLRFDDDIVLITFILALYAKQSKSTSYREEMRSNEVGPEGLQEMELNLKADIIFTELPPIVNTALLNFRRVVVRKNGEIRPLPYDPDEFVEPDDISCRINPVHRRILRAIGKERTRMEQMFEVEALLALGLTEAQIDRLYNSPLWTAHPVNMSEEQDSSETQELEQCQLKTKDGSSEQVWEVALILRSGVVRNNRSKGKQYTVIWKDWPWNDFSILAPHCFNSCKKLLAVDRREHLISQMALCMRENDERRFQELFPMFAKRHDYTNYHRVRLRMIEQSINDDLEELDVAPVYFENWTEDECATIDIKESRLSDSDVVVVVDSAPVEQLEYGKPKRGCKRPAIGKYLLKCTMSFSNYCEANAIGLALRLDYPENAAGCDCKGGQCTTSCPCIKVCFYINFLLNQKH